MKFLAILLLMVATVSCAQLLSKRLAELSVKHIKGFDVVGSIALHKVANPGLVFIEMTLVQNNLNDQRIYTVGQRKKGDAVVSIVNADYSYNTKMNLQFNLFYPPTGRNAALINYVMIRVQQYSSIGKAYIISGGVNKRHISIVLEANATTYFTYDASMYGTN